MSQVRPRLVSLGNPLLRGQLTGDKIPRHAVRITFLSGNMLACWPPRLQRIPDEGAAFGLSSHGGQPSDGQPTKVPRRHTCAPAAIA